MLFSFFSLKYITVNCLMFWWIIRTRAASNRRMWTSPENSFINNFNVNTPVFQAACCSVVYLQGSTPMMFACVTISLYSLQGMRLRNLFMVMYSFSTLTNKLEFSSNKRWNCETHPQSEFSADWFKIILRQILCRLMANNFNDRRTDKRETKNENCIYKCGVLYSVKCVALQYAPVCAGRSSFARLP